MGNNANYSCKEEALTRGVVRAAARPPESAPHRLDSKGRVGRPEQGQIHHGVVWIRNDLFRIRLQEEKTTKTCWLSFYVKISKLSRLYWYRGVTVLLPGWVIRKLM
jgi:hypothetical protein